MAMIKLLGKKTDDGGSKSVRWYLVVFHTTEEETVIIHTAAPLS